MKAGWRMLKKFRFCARKDVAKDVWYQIGLVLDDIKAVASDLKSLSLDKDLASLF